MLTTTNLQSLIIRIWIVPFALLSQVYSYKEKAQDFTEDNRHTVCTNSDCQLMSKVLLDNINPEVDPCHDFYEYACGRWPKYNPSPQKFETWNVGAVMQAATYQDVRKFLEEKVNRFDREEVAHVKRMYQACSKIPSLGRGNVRFVKSFGKQFRTLLSLPKNNSETRSKNQDWWMLDNYYLKFSGESALFDVSMMTHKQQNNEPLLMIQPLFSAYGSVIQIKDWGTDEKRMYIKYLVKLLRAVRLRKGLPSKSILLREHMERVVEFRQKLQKIIPRKRDDVCETVTVRTLQNIYDRSSQGNKAAKINWLEHVRVLLSHRVTQTSEDAIVGLCPRKYFVQLAKLLVSTPEIVIVHHVYAYFVERHLLLNPTRENLLDAVISAGLEEYVPTKVRFDSPRWLTCIKNNNMQHVLGRLYSETHLSRSAKTSLENIGSRIKQSMHAQILESSWVSERLGNVMRKTVSNVLITLGYPEFHNNPGLKLYYENQIQDPLKANAYFVHGRNEVMISAPRLQMPFYSPLLPDVITYGTIGFTIGHEIYHALYKLVSEIDTPPSMNSVSWPNEIIQECFKREKCFIDQYNGYPVVELSNSSIIIYNKGRKTAKEDFGDTMGLKTAYRAYRKQLKERNGECQLLPHFESVGCEKLFFIAFASRFCGKMTSLGIRRHLKTNLHSLPRYRVNGVLSNMKEFSAAFNCHAKSRMNAPVKCDFWD
ncbi:hypothetical protein KM043_015073 [Ampulex compressa]|uniref:Endothelin-converting enzyme 1-like protein 7 n=1 Tax=Ampulex compressa TaxID=860918 RepID=A0A1W6EW81_AMPCP|nr:endothelin-converting enzyme 1-like protein 7 [Ampulex compressa]KAG7208890.1 hypothetical protein KM043_015073 [Ampulex compressa]